MPFTFTPTRLKEVVLVEPQVFGDDRGFFMETFKKSDWEAAGLPTDFSQDNHSRSSMNVLRGLHFQMDPHAQGKLVRVTSGAIFDVAVDIRKGSSTFGQWTGHELSADNKRMLWVPVGFAHGLLVLEDSTDLLYKCTGEYQPEFERSIAWDDAAIGIEWPLEGVPQLSQKDQGGMSLADLRDEFSGPRIEPGATT